MGKRPRHDSSVPFLNSRDSTQRERENPDEFFPDIWVPIKPIKRLEPHKVKVDCRQSGALRACAADLYPLEAGTDPLISNGTFLHRDDFTTRFITCDTSSGAPMAAIDWDSAITALQAGGLHCSGGERCILQLSVSLAHGIPVDLQDAVTGLDDRNTALLITAIRHASGKRPENGRRCQPSPGAPG